LAKSEGSYQASNMNFSVVIDNFGGIKNSTGEPVAPFHKEVIGIDWK